MRRSLFLVPLLLAACLSPGRGRGGEPGPNDLVVCVQNDLAGYGDVTARADQVRYQVMAGTTVCRRIGVPGSRVALTAVTMGGGAAGPLSFAEPLTSTGPGCWLWRLGPSRADALLPLDCAELPDR